MGVILLLLLILLLFGGGGFYGYHAGWYPGTHYGGGMLGLVLIVLLLWVLLGD